MSYLKELKKAKIERLQQELYRQNPMYWIEHRLGENPRDYRWSDFPEYKTHKWDGDSDPLLQGWHVISNAYISVKNGSQPEYRNVAIESATGTSKTYMLARLVTWFLDVFPNSLVVTSAPKESQLKIGLWSEISRIAHKIKKIRPNAHLYKLRLVMDNTQFRDLDEDEDQELMADSWQAIGFTAGVAVNEESTTKARGLHREHMLIIAEECTGMAHAVLKAFINTCTGNMNFIFAVGNPTHELDPLHLFSNQPTTKALRISAFDYPNIVLGYELIKGAATTISIEERLLNEGEDSPLYKAMVRGISPESAEDSLIKKEWIEQCINIDIFKTGHKAIGVDVANSIAGDKGAVAYFDHNILTELKLFKCPSASNLAYNLFMTKEQIIARGYHNYNLTNIYQWGCADACLGIDSVGIGASTINTLVDNGIIPVSLMGGEWKDCLPTNDTTGQPLLSFRNLRAQMYWDLREAFRLKQISIQLKDNAQIERLIKQLIIIKYDTKTGAIRLESKDELKKRLGGKSPDEADAVVYGWWVSRGKRFDNTPDYLPVLGGSSFINVNNNED